MALLSTACGAPEYRYVANRQHGNYFKVPAAWHLENLTGKADAGRPEELDGGVVSLWHTSFDNARDPSGPAVDAEGLPAELVGSAEIYAISNSRREQYSMSAIRAQIFGGVDPLFADKDDLGEGRVNPVSYEPLNGDGGLSGSRVVANFNVAPEGEPARWMTADVSMLFDLQKGRIFVLSMQCSSKCYLENRPQVDEIARSWKVRT